MVDLLAIVLSVLLILWGGFVLYSTLFRMKKSDYADDSHLASIFIEFEFLSKILNRILAFKVIKGVTILIGISFITLGTVLFFI